MAGTWWVRLGWGMVAGGHWGGGLKVLVLGGGLVAGMVAALGGEQAGSLSRVESSLLLSFLLSSSLRVLVYVGCQNIGATLLWRAPRGFLLVGGVWVLWWGREGGGGGGGGMLSWGSVEGVGAGIGSSEGWCHGRFLGPRFGGFGWRGVSC